VAVVLFSPAPATAQDPPPQQQERPSGLPSRVSWTFNLDAGFGAFGFLNSLYTNNHEDPSGDLGENWFEGYVKPALSASFTLPRGQLYAKVSAVGERTYGAVPTIVGEDASSFQAEDLKIGWRSGRDPGENTIDVTVGRAEYTLGHGMLLWDGAGEGGSRGGYWSNARKAWEFAAIGRVKPGAHTAEVFYLDRDDLPETDVGNRLWGLNYEYAFGDESSLGVSYFRLFTDFPLLPRDGTNVFNVRAYVTPVPAVASLSVEGELATERNGDLRHSNAWTIQAGYTFEDIAWSPAISYRFALFEGNDPATPRNEAFDPLFVGFYDWGVWWQGEIAGEYFLSNSNLASSQVRVTATPNDRVGTGLMFYRFTLDEPASYAPGVTSDALGFEVDWYLDWEINSNFSVSILGAFANPGEAVRQALDRTANFGYGMVYLSYKY
jgi:hypothetical protein